MAQLGACAAQWLHADGGPLVFVCRTGRRARKAAASMRQQGHAQAWHLACGLAGMAEASPADACTTAYRGEAAVEAAP
jgi:rhodanese-related sulfurtransferase